MIFLYAFLMLLAIALPLVLIYRRVKNGHRGKTPLVANLCSFFGAMLVICVVFLSQGASAAEAAEGVARVSSDGFATGMGYLSAALSVGITSIGGGIAVAAAASSAMGALSENESLFGKSLIFVGLAEGLALYGLLIGFMIISKL